MQNNHPDTTLYLTRIRFWYGIIIIVMSIFLVRLFYLQIIRHDYYKNVALSGQYKQYQIPAKRGVIEAHSGSDTVPIVLNEVRYTLFADPIYVKDKDKVSNQIATILDKNQNEIKEKLSTDSRYVVLAKKLDKNQKEKLDKLSSKGIGTREESYRTYPQGEMAASLLGFVNDDGEGKYGIEQALNDKLSGSPGQLKAITDASGVPLAANKDNILEEPVNGKRVVLTIDMSMQQQVEDILKKGLQNARSESGSLLVMDINTGAIKAMANYPTYNPAEYYKQENASVFNNTNVSDPYEIGSVMKPLTMAAALNSGAVNKNQSYYDPSFFIIDEAKITNVEEDGGAAQRSMPDILRYSLNTGATWLLMQMGGGKINSKARNTWYDYLVNKYRFSQKTNIEQGYEAKGVVPKPDEGYGLNIKYANTAFGQGMTATTLQTGAAMASVLNGGTYYRPRLVDQIENQNGKIKEISPEVVNKEVVSAQTSQTIREFMEHIIEKNHRIYSVTMRPGYSLGGKTGTAEIAKPGGGYYEDRFNGTFTGFVGGDQPQYMIVARVNEPKIAGYAGSTAAGPIYGSVANMLIDNFGVLPKTK